MVLAVLGANGSGKSSLLKVLIGLWAPSEGHCAVSVPFGYAALDLALYPELSGPEHLELARSLRGDPGAGDWLTRVGLPEVGAKPVGAYSSGMRARLKLALALAAEPKLLLLDEPTASLDEPGRRLVAEIVEHQRRSGGAVVIATNDPEEAGWATHELRLD